jgi:hypothetical protein
MRGPQACRSQACGESQSAKVINLSLGGFGACDGRCRAVDEAMAQGAVIVAAAGSKSLGQAMSRRQRRDLAHGAEARSASRTSDAASTSPHPAATCR